MSDNLHALESWLAPLVARLAPAQRRQLATTVARELRRQQVANIRAQRAPDGTAWAPRKQPARNARGAIKRKAQAAKAGLDMFRKLRTPRHLQTRANPGEALVAIAARSQRIARVHQQGLVDRVVKSRADGPRYAYPARPLLGFGADGRALVLHLLMQHLRL